MTLLGRVIKGLVVWAILAAIGSAEAQPLQVTYVGNAGFLVLMGGKKILIDGCFRGFKGAYLLPQEIQDKLADARPPFDGIDLILATHDHGDHFDAGLVRRHLQNNPKAVFASTHQATARLADVQGRVVSFEASRGKADRRDVAGIHVEAIYLPHGAPAPGTTEILNYGYVVSVGGFSVFHTGDIDPSQCPFDEFRAYRLPAKHLDVAFIQHYCLGDDAADRRLVRDGIGASHIVASHYHLTDPPLNTSSVLRNYPEAILFATEMDTWVAPRRGNQRPDERRVMQKAAKRHPATIGPFAGRLY